jgi:hypothetical protein
MVVLQPVGQAGGAVVLSCIPVFQFGLRDQCSHLQVFQFGLRVQCLLCHSASFLGRQEEHAIPDSWPGLSGQHQTTLDLPEHALLGKMITHPNKNSNQRLEFSACPGPHSSSLYHGLETACSSLYHGPHYAIWKTAVSNL